MSGPASQGASFDGNGVSDERITVPDSTAAANRRVGIALVAISLALAAFSVIFIAMRAMGRH